MTDKEKEKWFMHGFRASTKKQNGETNSLSDWAGVDSLPVRDVFHAHVDAEAAFPLDKTAQSLPDVTESDDAKEYIAVNARRLEELRRKERGE